MLIIKLRDLFDTLIEQMPNQFLDACIDADHDVIYIGLVKETYFTDAELEFLDDLGLIPDSTGESDSHIYNFMLYI